MLLGVVFRLSPSRLIAADYESRSTQSPASHGRYRIMIGTSDMNTGHHQDSIISGE
ncbi:hypothetical protein K8I31_13930 [bacterium]|nr:hypothetical protein [bacterium]